MNKITIPALLVATVMVAGAFAFMPVEQASTVHTTSATTLSTAQTALIADEMLEIREISVANVDFNGAQAITITGADAADRFTLLTLEVKPGSTGTPMGATEEMNLDAATVDGGLLTFTANTDDDITAGGLEYISLLDINPPTGNIIDFEMTSGTATVADGDTITITAQILIRNSAGNPVITTE